MVNDLNFATVDEATFNKLVALMRNRAPRKPPSAETLWRGAYHKTLFARQLVGVQSDLFGAKPVTYMRRTKPDPALTWTPEPVEEKLARIARDPQAMFDVGRPALSPEERSAVIDSAANWLRIAQRVRIVGSFAFYDGRSERRVGRQGVIWRLQPGLCRPHLRLSRSGRRRTRREDRDGGTA